MDNWKDEAVRLHNEGISGRKIATTLGKSKSTINSFLQKRETTIKDNSSLSPENVNSPNILLLDIETKPIIAQVWKLWDNDVALNQVESDWSILAWCAKWLGEENVYYEDVRNESNIDEDKTILGHLWNLLNKADVVIGHNSKKFDIKKINARLILNGYPKPSPYRQIDTLEIAKREFGFTSNKLEYLTKNLCSAKKISHAKYPGHTLWVECMKGNIEAWDSMQEYNTMDVLSLEELYMILSSWDSKLPNFDVYVDNVLDMEEWEKEGFTYTNLGKYQVYRNKKTGMLRRSRINLLSKEKRDSLLRNV